MLDAAQHLAAGRLDDLGRVFFQRVAKRVVGRHEIPVLAALLDDGTAGAACQRHGVVGVVHGVRRAFFIGQARGTGADGHEDFFLFGRDLGHRQAGAGIGAADQHVDALLVEPFARFRGGDVGLVLMVGGNEFHLLAGQYHAGIGDRHLDGFRATEAVDVGIHARHVGNKTDLDGVARYLGVRGAGQAQCAKSGGGNGDSVTFHSVSVGIIVCYLNDCSTTIRNYMGITRQAARSIPASWLPVRMQQRSRRSDRAPSHKTGPPAVRQTGNSVPP